MSEELAKFIDHLIAEKGLTNLDDEVLKQVKTDLYDRLEDRVNVAIVDNMPEEKMADFEKVLDGGDQATMQDFCQKTIPDLQNVVAKELLKFRQLYL